VTCACARKALCCHHSRAAHKRGPLTRSTTRLDQFSRRRRERVLNEPEQREDEDQPPNKEKHLKRTIWLVLAAAIASLIATSVATAATGTWSQYPNGGTEYQAQVQQPIKQRQREQLVVEEQGRHPGDVQALVAHCGGDLRIDLWG
jgi:anti-sigma factor RsiW